MKPINTEIDDAYELLWQVLAKARKDGVDKFEVSTTDIENEEVRVWCKSSDLKEILNKIDNMCGR